MKIDFCYIFIISMLMMLMSCEEAKRFEISEGDSTPPSAPVFLSSKALSGGARIFYQRPTDEDLLSVEAAFTNDGGRQLRYAASYFVDSLDLMGFGAAGDHTIDLYAVDRAGNKSTVLHPTVTSLDPAITLVAQSMQIVPSFGVMMLKWDDPLNENIEVRVDFTATQNGAKKSYTQVLASNQTRASYNVVLTEGTEQVDVKVNVADKYGNSTFAKDTSIVLLTDAILDKTGWSLPSPGDVFGATQADGEMAQVIDGLTEATAIRNFYLTDAANPWNIIIDMGAEYELSRIVTNQRHSWTDNSLRGAYYRGDNVLSYNMYIYDEAAAAWEFVSRHTIVEPTVKQEADYKTLGDAGDPAYLYPDEPAFTKPTRYFRFEALSGHYISEITLYGRPKN